MKLAHADQLGSVEVRHGVSRRVFTGDGATLAWTTLEPGHTPRPHSHDYEQIVYIVSGRVRFTVGDEPAVDLSIFTPRRNEYAAEESLPH